MNLLPSATVETSSVETNTVAAAAATTTVESQVVEKAALLSENIVKVLMMRKGHEDTSFKTIPSRGNLDQYLWGQSTNTLPTVSTSSNTIDGSSSSYSIGTMTTSESRLSPAAYLMQELSRVSSKGCSPHSVAALDNVDMFQQATEEDRNDFDHDAIQAINDRNIDQLRVWHETKTKSLKTSNAFGETLLHIACRRGYVDVVQFLTVEAKLTLWVHDEQGKTPLHLACHSAEPPFELIDFAVRRDPDLLFVADMRGCMPLDYAPRETWDGWIAFFRGKEFRDIVPRRALFFTFPPSTQSSLKALPFLDDIDRILSEYHASRKSSSSAKKQKKRLKASSSRSNSDLSSEDEELQPQSVRLKKKITEVILDKMNFDSLQDLSALDTDTLLLTLQMQRQLDRKIGGKPKLHAAFVADEERHQSSQQLLMHGQSSTSASVATSSDRIELLKHLEDLKIRHVRAATSVEIALEVEKQGQSNNDTTTVQTARMEVEALRQAIKQIEWRLHHDWNDSEISRAAGPFSDADESNRSRRSSMAMSVVIVEEEGEEESIALSTTQDITSPVPTHTSLLEELAITPQQQQRSLGQSEASLTPPAQLSSPESDGTRQTQPPTEDDESDCNICICERLAREEGMQFDLNHIRCGCTEGANCHLQLTFPIPDIAAAAALLEPKVITRRESMGGRGRLSPMRGGGGALARGRGVVSSMGLFRKTLRDEMQS